MTPFTFAQTVDFQPRLITGMMNYQYQETWSNKTTSGGEVQEWKDTIPFIGVGGTLSKGKFTLDFYAQQSDTGKGMLWQDIPDSSFGTEKEKSFNFSRRDYLIMFGYNNPFAGTLFEGVGFSLGWKRGEFELGTVERFYGGNSGVSIIPRPMERKSSGPVLAVSYGIPVTSAVFLGFNLGLGRLSDQFNILPVGKAQGQIVETQTYAPVVGIRGEILMTDRLSLNLSIDYSSLKGKGYEFGSASNKRTVDANETVTSLRASLKWNFNF